MAHTRTHTCLVLPMYKLRCASKVKVFLEQTYVLRAETKNYVNIKQA